MTELADRPVASTPAVGQSVRRKEDARLLTGNTNWTDNIQLPGALHMVFVRSPHAHAKITRVDLSGALAMPGVVAAYSAADLGEANPKVICVWPVVDDIVMPEFPALAIDEVRHGGDCVAVVLATERYLAADAAEAVEVDYEPLPAVIDMEAALADGAPLVHADKGTNKCYSMSYPCGDYAKAAAEADVVVKRRFVNQRLIPSAMEPRAVVAAPMGNVGDITVWSATQIPHVLRLLLALTTGIPENKLRVIAPDVGGGFGAKLQMYREEQLCTVIANKLGRPVKWTETRTENMVATHHGRDQIQYLELAAKADGTLLGMKVDLIANMGAYLQIITPGIPLLGQFMFNSIYKMDAYEFGCTGVFTTTTPTDAYRGAGRPEATFGIERMMDELAAELGRDPMDLRRQNWITHEEFPFDTISGLTYDSGNYEAATDRAMELFDYDGLRAEQQRRRESGDPVQLGLGISTFTEMCGLAPSKVLGSLKYAAGGWEHCTIRVLPTGTVELVTGTSPHGQGHATAWSQIAADALGVAVDDITVIFSDTGMAPYGMDTYGSRSLAVGGRAILAAADSVVAKARLIAAHMLEVSADDLEFVDGSFKVKGDPEQAKTIQAAAWEAFTAHNLPDGIEPTLFGASTIDPEAFSFPHGTHLCAMEVDTETGKATIRKYVAVDDVGVQVNPMIVEGQIHGGLAQGIAQAMWEGAAYDEDGNLVTASLADYLLPTAVDVPEYVTDRTVTPSTTHPLGTKGVGEAGTIASTPAVVNAVIDAIRHLGVADVTMPCTPQTVWRALQAATEGGAE
ncbi:xanthine dehydrogenase family protein molybdopterin-binding subunit [Nakamurella multipartita]|uniref:Aldehyde oxidase and xanthine dehydrogenase molybdopterin binding n=1 Tax=Nakamurella multipartita (strain ATCC 700099 / DSM 44233 / CIP 104796 / JCM 9543 / NBRC 105858 / Y-104) TaxID=479431 RepID=C8XIH1_NAKMY|nr:xanthine dehydrogenase family protein molybdopterin-binding subunit [Nakamurella multipartita]ACV80436.1 aldehyde oxidase and xanthine dehydrogenase molybdopterin binding [Nakamurella multipartita DSM 44233]